MWSSGPMVSPLVSENISQVTANITIWPTKETVYLENKQQNNEKSNQVKSYKI